VLGWIGSGTERQQTVVIGAARKGTAQRLLTRAYPDDASETIRYLTGGVPMRLNRLTQQLEPELATSWKVSDSGKTISFKLRENVRFSDGTAFSADGDAYTSAAPLDPRAARETANCRI
jgi:ABC-type transport system substrate-binding protein